MERTLVLISDHCHGRAKQRRTGGSAEMEERGD
jgi:hypothetical protein